MYIAYTYINIKEGFFFVFGICADRHADSLLIPQLEALLRFDCVTSGVNIVAVVVVFFFFFLSFPA